MNLARILSVVLRVALGLVLVYAAYTKLRQSWLLFAMSIDSYQLLPQWGVLALARTLPWFELLVGVILISGLWLRYAATAAAALFILFFSAMITSYARGLQIDCGCFGPGEALSATTLTRDGILLAAAICLAILALRRRPLNATR